MGARASGQPVCADGTALAPFTKYGRRIGGRVDLRVDNDVRTARPMTRDASLPALEQLPVHQPALPDRIGSQLRERLGLVAGTAGIGAIGAALLARGGGAGSLGAVGTGLLGALGGAAVAVAGGVAFDATFGGTAPRRSAAAAASAAPAADRIVADEHLRVMSFNVHMGIAPGALLGDDAAMANIAAAIRRERPDVVLLQEVDRFAPLSGWRDMTAELAEHLDADGAVHAPSTRTATGRESGTAVLTFNGTTVSDARSILSPDVRGDGALRRMAGGVDAVSRLITGLAGEPRAVFGIGDYRPRATADVLVQTPAGTAVRVLSGHWSWAADGVDHPRRQVDPLAGLLGAWDGATIVGGDFNVRSGTRDGALEARAFAGAGMTDAFTKAGIEPHDRARNTFGAGTPRRAIDRIYASDRLEVRRVRVAPFEPGATPPSDHHPVVVDYALQRDVREPAPPFG